MDRFNESVRNSDCSKLVAKRVWLGQADIAKGRMTEEPFDEELPEFETQVGGSLASAEHVDGSDLSARALDSRHRMLSSVAQYQAIAVSIPQHECLRP